MKPGDEATALAYCVEQPLNPLVQRVRSCKRGVKGDLPPATR